LRERVASLRCVDEEAAAAERRCEGDISDEEASNEDELEEEWEEEGLELEEKYDATVLSVLDGLPLGWR
jgi:hypothetical protein